MELRPWAKKATNNRVKEISFPFLSLSNMSNLAVLNLTNVTMKDEATKDVFSVVFISITIIIILIACPFTIGLNVLVITAVNLRSRLQSNANIMLACLAVTDELAGLTSQPFFIL